MNGLLLTVLSLSVSGTLLLLALLAVKRLAGGRFSRQWQYYIWLLVIARLLLPAAPENSLVGAAFDGLFPREDTPALVATNQVWVKAPAESGSTGAIQAVGEDAARLTRLLSALTASLWVVWLAVALALFLRRAALYRGFVRQLKAGWRPVEDPDALDRLARIKQRAGVRREVGLYTNSLVSTPLLVGLLRPCVVIPRLDLPEDDFTYTVLHELTHCKRWDIGYKWLMQLTLCLHWFNPFVHWLGRRVSRDCELSCDEAVIRRLDSRQKRAYGDTLIHAMAAGGYHGPSAPVTLSESKELLKERLGAIMEYKKMSRAAVAAVLALTCVAGAGALAAGAYNGSPAQRAKEGPGYLSRQESLAASFAPYAAFGLVYDQEQDMVFYQGEPVAAFVDLREILPGGGYAFNVGYFDEVENGLYLSAARDKKGKVIGVEPMPEQMKSDLYDAKGDRGGSKDWSENQGAWLDVTGLLEALSSLDELFEWKSQAPLDGWMYATFDATTHLSEGVHATDHFAKGDVPRSVQGWADALAGDGGVHVKQTVSGGQMDAWVYYGGQYRLAWRIEAQGTALRLELIDPAPDRIAGGTLIHCWGPADYRDIQVFLNGRELTVG